MTSLAEQAVSFLATRQPPSPPPQRAPGVGFGPGELAALGGAGWEPCGLVAGASVHHVGVLRWPAGNVEVGQLSGALNSGRAQALAGLLAHARALGAEGVLDVNLDLHFGEEHRHLPRFILTGTAVRRAGARSAPSPRRGKDRSDADPPFTAAMSPAQLSMLERAGYRPVGVVMGTCVFHVGRRAFLQWARTQRQSVEMTSYTVALYEARSLAMARLQEESAALGADGVIGVTTAERSHVWGDHVIEFFASGTAVRSIGAPAAGSDRPALVVTLADPISTTDPVALTGTGGGEGRG